MHLKNRMKSYKKGQRKFSKDSYIYNGGNIN
jgi:hypothetical protein